MNLGDMIVQAVSEDLVVHDIRFSVPRGIATVIPGNLACDSRDLGRLMSENKIIRLDTNPRLESKVATQSRMISPESQVVAPLVDTPEVIELRTQLQKALADLRSATLELQKVRADLESSRTECGQLLAELSKLRVEMARLKEEKEIQASAAVVSSEIELEADVELESEESVLLPSSVPEPPKSSKKMTKDLRKKKSG